MRTRVAVAGWTALAALAALAAAGVSTAGAQPAPVAAIPADDPVFIPGTLEQVAGGYIFTEGPVWDGARLIFSDIPGDTVYVYTPGEGPPQVLYAPSAQANGHTFDLGGALLNAEHASGEITRWTPQGGRQTVVASFEGKHLNSPNDVVVRSDGMLFFTDPPYGLAAAYQGVQRRAELDFSGVFAFEERTGRMVLIEAALARPNGLAFSPDERVLYVGDSATQTLWAYDIAADGSASGRRQLADLTSEGKPGAVDGMRVDREGRIFSTCPGGVCVVAPDGTLVTRLELPRRATNLAWAGRELDELYITSLSDVYLVKTRARGIGSSSLAPR